MAKMILKKNKVGRLTLPDLKTYYKAEVIDSVVLQKDKHMSQWNRIDCPERNPSFMIKGF